VGEFAGALTTLLALGRGEGADLLSVAFSALDTIGHDYGPHSHEVQDTLAALDETIGRLLDTLDAAVGRDRYVVAFSADHGVSALPEQAPTLGLTAGRMGSTLVRETIEAALTTVFGRGGYVVAVYGTNVYFAKGIAERVFASPEAKSAIAAALLQLPGVHGLYWKPDMESEAPTPDPLLRSLRRSHHRERGSDLVVLPKANWLFRPDDADHGTPHAYDVAVPIVLYGAGVKAGRYPGPAAPEDIAPTLAALLGLAIPGADGRVLDDPIKR
jgi:arylsulfatase A-like enzyme